MKYSHFKTPLHCFSATFDVSTSKDEYKKMNKGVIRGSKLEQGE